jgi:hypothetical protein
MISTLFVSDPIVPGIVREANIGREPDFSTLFASGLTGPEVMSEENIEGEADFFSREALSKSISTRSNTRLILYAVWSQGAEMAVEYGKYLCTYPSE